MSNLEKFYENKFEKVKDALKASGIEFHLNSKLEPTVFVSEDGFQQEWPVDSVRFKDFVVALWFETFRSQIPQTTEINFLLTLLREDCRKGGRRLMSYEAEENEIDPIIQTVLELMNQSPSFEDLTSKLLDKLLEIQARNLFSMQRQITGFTNLFSRQLRRLTPTLRGYGVEVTVWHEEKGSRVKLERTEQFQPEPRQVGVRMDSLPDGSDGSLISLPSVVTLEVESSSTIPDGTDGENKLQTTTDSNGEQSSALSEGGEK